MKRALFAILALAICAISTPALATGLEWQGADIMALKRWVVAAPDDALCTLSTRPLDQAQASGDPQEVDDAATMLGLRLARMHLLGCASTSERAGWNILDSDRDIALEPLLAQAVASDTLDTFFAQLRPKHPEYAAMRSALAAEQDETRRKAIARNMERWRWMPQSLGPDYIIVNAAKFEADLWRSGRKAGTWRVIVGKTGTPTPVFNTTVTGVILNPWWEIPASIVRESVGSLVRRNPALARSRGYVWSGGRYRQRPGPNNALGQMKLVMPNRFSVYMHDTPAKQLFDEKVRAFSHGCIRTGDALGYAATLLEGVKTREEVDAIVASGQTTTVNLAKPLPIYIAYFTAVQGDDGGIEVLEDLYNRDRRVSATRISETCGG